MARILSRQKGYANLNMHINSTATVSRKASENAQYIELRGRWATTAGVWVPLLSEIWVYIELTRQVKVGKKRKPGKFSPPFCGSHITRFWVICLTKAEFVHDINHIYMTVYSVNSQVKHLGRFFTYHWLIYWVHFIIKLESFCLHTVKMVGNPHKAFLKEWGHAGH